MDEIGGEIGKGAVLELAREEPPNGKETSREPLF